MIESVFNKWVDETRCQRSDISHYEPIEGGREVQCIPRTPVDKHTDEEGSWRLDWNKN